MGQKIILFTLCIFLISLISAQELGILLQPHYYYNSKPVLVYTDSAPFDGISFSIYGENFNTDARIKNIEISKASPDLFYDSLLKSEEMLRITEKKTLWNSAIIDLSKYKQGENITFILGVQGTNENTLGNIYVEEEFPIMINNPKLKQVPMLYLIGEKIYPSNPTGGVIIFFILVGTIISTIWWKRGWTKIKLLRAKAQYKRRRFS